MTPAEGARSLHERTARARADRNARLLLLGLVAIVFAASLMLAGAYPLIDPDEGRNAEVAREMAAGSGLVIPHLAGMPYLDKPPLLFWAQAAAFSVFGVTRFAARLPAAVAAAIVLYLIGSLALERGGAKRMVMTVAFAATAPLFFVLSAYVIFDMLLAACVVALWVLLVRDSDPAALFRAPIARRTAMFLALALGVLVKGPVMLAWGLGGPLSVAAMLRSRAPLRWLGWWPGWVLFFLVAGGWFAFAIMQHPEYPHYAFVDETLRRMTTGAFEREQGLWFVPAVLAGGALPWSLGTPWSRKLGHASKVALGFLIFATLFFTLSRSKLVTYLLPVLPLLAWIAAEAWSSAARARRGSVGIAIVLAAVAITGWVFGTNPVLWGTRIGPEVVVNGMRGARLLAGILAAGSIVALIGAWKRHPWPALAAALAFTPAVLLTAGPTLLDHASAQSGEPLARAIQVMQPGAVVRYEHVYSPGTDFLLGRRSLLVSDLGHETTSNYQVYYREHLIERGLWLPVSSAAADSTDDDSTDDDPATDDSTVEVIVRPSHAAAPAGWTAFHRDRRFAAYRR